jgi:hypothetical protein
MTEESEVVLNLTWLSQITSTLPWSNPDDASDTKNLPAGARSLERFDRVNLPTPRRLGFLIRDRRARLVARH